MKEGLIFVNKNSEYMHGLNPSVLVWKDQNTSQYPIDTDNGVITEEVYGTGSFNKKGEVYTLDNELVGQVSLGYLNGWKKGFLRFSFNGFKFENDKEKRIRLMNFLPIKLKGNKQVFADPLSRLIFQYRVRKDPLKFE